MRTEKEKLQREIIDALYDKYNNKEYCTELVCEAMDIWHEQQVNNLDKADVIKCDGNECKALLIDFISWYLNVFSRDKKLTKTKTPIQSIDIFLKSINSL